MVEAVGKLECEELECIFISILSASTLQRWGIYIV